MSHSLCTHTLCYGLKCCSDAKYPKFPSFSFLPRGMLFPLPGLPDSPCRLGPSFMVELFHTSYQILPGRVGHLCPIMIGILYHKPLFTHFFPTPRRKLNYFKWVIYYCNPIFFFFFAWHTLRNITQENRMLVLNTLLVQLFHFTYENRAKRLSDLPKVLISYWQM